MDWHSRKVLAWALSTTLDTRFCVEAFHKAVLLEGRAPDIFNTDQGCQFTAREWVQALQSHPGLRISMDGKGRWVDNVFIERLWRSVKYEDVYLRDYETVPDLHQGLKRYFAFYNSERPHAPFLNSCLKSGFELHYMV
jgi:putative transposase